MNKLLDLKDKDSFFMKNVLDASEKHNKNLMDLI